MALLSAVDILNAEDLETKDVEVPEWGGTVRVRALTGAERDKLEASVVKQQGRKQKMNLLDFRAKLVAGTAINEAGQLIFTEADIRALSQKSAGALDKVAAVASKLSGMSEEDVEELVSDFEDDQSEDSTSD